MTGRVPGVGREDGDLLTVIFDHTALLALARTPAVSQLIVSAEKSQALVLSPAMCVAAATAERPAIADHVGGLAVTIVDLTFSAARTSGRLIADGLPWQFAHAAAVAAPSFEWPAGLAVLTAEPAAYDGLDLTLVPLG